jgi:hypothetical protein
MTLVCVLCGGVVEESTAYRRVSGWERKAVAESRKSGSDIVLRETSGELACSSCISRLRLGLNVQQEALL